MTNAKTRRKLKGKINAECICCPNSTESKYDLSLIACSLRKCPYGVDDLKQQLGDGNNAKETTPVGL